MAHNLRIDLATAREIAARRVGRVEAHESDLPLVHPSGSRRKSAADPADLVAGLVDNRSWLMLYRVRDDEVFRPLADALLLQLADLGWRNVEIGMSLICASPDSVTPVHLDVHDVILLQLAGTKTFTTGVITDRRLRAAELRRRFRDGENLTHLPEVHTDWVLRPGVGAFMPAYTPHWAIVGSEPSIALSIAIGTPAQRHRAAIHRADTSLLRHGIRLPAPGRSRLVDEMRLRAVQSAHYMVQRVGSRFRTIG